jgi:ATP-binding cassette subfamily B protein
MFQMMDWPAELPDAAGCAAPRHGEGNVTASGVCFGYHKRRRVLSNLCFKAEAGQRIALVGPTGCGKTTLINLLMRFYEMDDGVVEVDGTDVTRIKRDALRRLYGMVLQDTWLKQATVRENLVYGKPGATDDEVEKAAKGALAHRFIMRLPNGYNTVLASGGENLSAGQRQLLCIARIILARPDMLILDEATSNIDTRTEKLIQRALERLMEGRTSFIVAHRLSTIENADCILVMDAGQIVERGNHNELMRKNGFYAKLYESQFGNG